MSLRSKALRYAGLVPLALLLASPALAQQTEIHRYDVYAGFAGFDTPWLSLTQQGFHTQAGMNLRPWLSVGFDYSEATGSNVLTPAVLKPALEQQLNTEIAGLILLGQLPPGYKLSVPMDAFSETFAMGPQLDYRHWKPVTLFVRPSLGAIRQKVTPHPTDPFATAVIAQLAPAGYKLDWQGFYGFGGGFDWNAMNHFAIRAQTDVVYWDLFNDLLAHGSWTTRYSIGLTYRFGRNIVQ
jgi:hypothetical protein